MTSHTARWLRVAVLCLVALVVAESRALAQTPSQRGGFTVLVNFGVGIQNDTFLEESAVGIGGVNLGVGGFLSEDLALMFRFSGTNVAYDFDLPGNFYQVSGVGGPTLQYWVSDRFNLEAGLGFGVWNVNDAEESGRGLGLILGAGVTIFNRGKHNLQIGVEYAPAFTKPGTVHNVGFTLGYQFF